MMNIEVIPISDIEQNPNIVIKFNTLAMIEAKISFQYLYCYHYLWRSNCRTNSFFWRKDHKKLLINKDPFTSDARKNSMNTAQQNFWIGDFGKQYTDRNTFSRTDWQQTYKRIWGISREKMNDDFVSELPRDSRILEVGCNIGLQLRALQDMGFTQLYGIELQAYAVEKSREICSGINIIQGSGFDIPFKDNYFDVVCTNGVLIHIAPKDLPTIMREMVRVCSKYIWGFEYYADDVEEIHYRGNHDKLWKGNYSAMFNKYFDFQTLRIKDYPYIEEEQKGNVDRMYLMAAPSAT